MNARTLLTNFFFFYLSMVSLVFARPLQSRDVYTPRVLYPTKGTVWTAGENYTVTWDTSEPPQQITNPIGHIQLRKGNETLPLFLASNFSILLGSIEMQVPSVPLAHDYRVVLFGDSGNWSPVFTITPN